MKIDLIKEERKIIIDSLGVATGEITRKKIIATEINGEVISMAQIEKEETRTAENDRIFISQTINVIMVQLPHKVSIKEKET